MFLEVLIEKFILVVCVFHFYRLSRYLLSNLFYNTNRMICWVNTSDFIHANFTFFSNQIVTMVSFLNSTWNFTTTDGIQITRRNNSPSLIWIIIWHLSLKYKPIKNNQWSHTFKYTSIKIGYATNNFTKMIEPLNWFNTATLLKCLYLASRVGGHVFICKGYRFCQFLRFSNWILESEGSYI